MGMMCTNTGCRVETSPFAIIRNSRSFRCAARSFLRIVVPVVTVFAMKDGMNPPRRLYLLQLCHRGAPLPAPGGYTIRNIVLQWTFVPLAIRGFVKGPYSYRSTLIGSSFLGR